MTAEDRLAIREETPADREAILAVNRGAFGGEDEARLVARLHDDGDALFGLVAAIDGDVVGNILFSRLPITLATGRLVPAAALAPLAIVPEWQRQGIGAALVREGLQGCRERGLAAVIVLGDPTFYTRFGFSVEQARGLQTPWSGPHLMAVEMAPGSFGDGVGVARYAAAFTTLER